MKWHEWIYLAVFLICLHYALSAVFCFMWYTSPAKRLMELEIQLLDHEIQMLKLDIAGK